MAEKEKMVRIRIPLDPFNTADEFIGVNGRTFQLKRGEVVDVPPCVAKIIDERDRIRMERYRKIQALTKQ